MSTRVLASGISPVRWFHVLTVRGCHIKTIINHQLNKRDQEGREKGGEKGGREGGERRKGGEDNKRIISYTRFYW